MLKTSNICFEGEQQLFQLWQQCAKLDFCACKVWIDFLSHPAGRPTALAVSFFVFGGKQQRHLC